MSTPWTYFLLTFGCKVNQYESQALREAFAKAGGLEAKKPEDAQIICINSCAVTAKGEAEGRRAITQMQKKNPKATLIFTGCAAKFLDSCQNASAASNPKLVVIPQTEKARLLDQENIYNLLKNNFEFARLKTENFAFPPFEIQTYQRSRPVVKVQDGCRHFCTYCIVPTTRPISTSRPKEEVLKEVQRLLRAGFFECMLSGTNLQEYRDGDNSSDFWDLLLFLERELAPEFAGLARLRLSSLEPSQLTERSLEILAKSRLICPHLHLSLQHANQHLLRRMGRGHYKASELLANIASMKSFWPRFGLGVDLISGFPGEDEAAHRELLSFCEALPLTYGHVFPYSKRPGTQAAKFKEQVERSVKLRRALELRTLLAQKKENFARTLLKEKAKLTLVLQDKKRCGLSEYYVPCQIDRDSPANFVQVCVKTLGPKGLLGTIIDGE